MPIIKKATNKERDHHGNAIVSDKVKDHGNDTFVQKKLEEGRAFIRENGLKGLPGFTDK